MKEFIETKPTMAEFQSQIRDFSVSIMSLIKMNCSDKL